jgi:hypothetical protein
MTICRPEAMLKKGLRGHNRVRLIAGLLAAIAIGGCSGPRDQTEARLKAMPYTLDNIAEEAANRFQAMQKRPSEAARGPAAAGSEERPGASDGPGGNPFTTEAIAKDLVGKLQRLTDAPLGLQLQELERKLKAMNTLKDDDLNTLMQALKAAAAELPPPTP